MPFTALDLPYAAAALSPQFSAQTIQGLHQQYLEAVQRLNQLCAEQAGAETTLENIIKQASGELLAAATQVWTFPFFWNNLVPHAAGVAIGPVAVAIKKVYGSEAAFLTAFEQAALQAPDKNWLWLVKNADKSIEIMTTGHEEHPLRVGKKPLLVCNISPQAYAKDYPNNLSAYLAAYWKLVDWDFAAKNYLF